MGLRKQTGLSLKAVTEPDRTEAPEITEVRRRTITDRCGQ